MLDLVSVMVSYFGVELRLRLVEERVYDKSHTVAAAESVLGDGLDLMAIS